MRWSEEDGSRVVSTTRIGRSSFKHNFGVCAVPLDRHVDDFEWQNDESQMSQILKSFILYNGFERTSRFFKPIISSRSVKGSQCHKSY